MVTVIQEAQHRRHVVQGFVLPPRYYGVAVVQYVRDSGLEHLGDWLESRPFYEGPARRDAQPCPFVESDDRGGAVLVELSDALGPRLCVEVLDRREEADLGVGAKALVEAPVADAVELGRDDQREGHEAEDNAKDNEYVWELGELLAWRHEQVRTVREDVLLLGREGGEARRKGREVVALAAEAVGGTCRDGGAAGRGPRVRGRVPPNTLRLDGERRAGVAPIVRSSARRARDVAHADRRAAVDGGEALELRGRAGDADVAT